LGLCTPPTVSLRFALAWGNKTEKEPYIVIGNGAINLYYKAMFFFHK